LVQEKKFHYYDKDGDGTIGRTDFEAVYEEMGWNVTIDVIEGVINKVKKGIICLKIEKINDLSENAKK
jgi:Ca2+-binding EF-hand superfamily protein